MTDLKRRLAVSLVVRILFIILAATMVVVSYWESIANLLDRL